MELVTGRAGIPHITSQQDRQKHQGVWGTGAYILKTGNNLEPVVQSSNNIQIKDGALMAQGALFSVKVGTVDEVTIANGSQGMQRKDVIVARYTYNQGANTEKAEWAVVQGTPVASNPQIPQIAEGDIQDGDATVDTAVFIVTLDGINITAVDVVPETAPDMKEIKAQLDALNGKIHTSYIPTSESGNATTVKMISGSITPVSNSASTSRLMFTIDQLREKFGTQKGSNSMAAFASNGDGYAQDAHIDGTTWNNNGLYAVLDRSVAGAVRINYVIFCWE